MPPTTPSGKFPLVSYLSVEQKYVDNIDKTLRRASRELSKRIADAAGKNPLTRAQLQAQQAAIKSYLGKDWTDIQKTIDAGQHAAAAEASKVVSRYESVLLSGVIKPEELADIVAAEAQRAASGVRTMMDRLRASQKPLSTNVYNTKRLVEGQVDRAVNVALASGMNAATFAKYMKDYISPAVPGGASYAAKRLARTEINNAYHASSVKRYQESKLVEVVDWHLSGSHPEGDVCDDMKDGGPYPVDQVPEKPHPLCFCYTTPSLPSREQFIENLFNGDYDDEEWIDSVEAETSKSLPNNSAKFKPVTSAQVPHLNAPLPVRSGGRFAADDPTSQAIANYTARSNAINKKMRDIDTGVAKTKMNSATQEIVDRLTIATNEGVLQTDAVLWRGIDKAALKEPLSLVGDDISKLVGTTLRDGAFTSTTIDAAVARDFGAYQIRILAPKGTRGVYVSDHSIVANQSEFLLAPGNNFKVLKVTKEGRKTVIDVLLSQDPIEKTVAKKVATKKVVVEATKQVEVSLNRPAVGDLPAWLGERGTAAEVKEFVDDRKRRLIEAVDRGVNVQMSETSLKRLVSNGRFKTVHETGKSSQQFGGYLEVRSAYEKTVMGVADNVPNKAMPVYGHGMGATKADRAEKGWRQLNSYGGVSVELKDSVLNRTTWTIGDSMTGQARPLFTSEVRKASAEEIVEASSHQALDKVFWNHDPGYIEAQVHGGVSLDDVKKVTIPIKSQGKVGSLPDVLREKGIEVEWI